MTVGTIADVASLLGENHTLVQLGMQRLNATRKPGLRALIRNAGLKSGRLRERDIAFGLAPRINAAGRMEHASIAFELLTAEQPEQAQELADRLERLNLERQRQTETLMLQVREEARHHPDDAVVLVSGENWPEGIIGLVAGRLAEEIKRPVLVLSRGTEFSRGSARSQEGYNMIYALRDCAPLLERYGGHAQAAGFTIANERIEALRRHLLAWSGEEALPIAALEPRDPLAEEAAPPSTTGDQEGHDANSARRVDLVVTRPDFFRYSTYARLRKLGPFGADNPEPVFKIENLRLLSCWTSGVEGRNLKMRLGIGSNGQLSGTLTRGGPRLSSFKGVQHVTIIFRLEPAWVPGEGESTQDITLRILEAEPVR